VIRVNKVQPWNNNEEKHTKGSDESMGKTSRAQRLDADRVEEFGQKIITMVQTQTPTRVGCLQGQKHDTCSRMLFKVVDIYFSFFDALGSINTKCGVVFLIQCFSNYIQKCCPLLLK
jgi:hypothetical protein